MSDLESDAWERDEPKDSDVVAAQREELTKLRSELEQARRERDQALEAQVRIQREKERADGLFRSCDEEFNKLKIEHGQLLATAQEYKRRALENEEKVDEPVFMKWLRGLMQLGKDPRDGEGSVHISRKGKTWKAGISFHVHDYTTIYLTEKGESLMAAMQSLVKKTDETMTTMKANFMATQAQVVDPLKKENT